MSSTMTAILTTLISVAVGLLAITLDELRDRRARRPKRPQWMSWPLDDQHPFNSDFAEPRETSGQLTKPAITRVAFWNGGNETIRRKDYLDAYQFQIRPRRGVKVISSRVVRKNGLGNNVSLGEMENGAIPISFDYLKSQQGALIDVYHSGDSPRDISVVGEIIDGHSLGYVVPPVEMPAIVMIPRFVRQRIGNRASYYLATFLECVTTLLAIVGIAYFLPASQPESSVDVGLGNPIDLFIVTMQSTLLILLVIKSRVKIPADLRPFDRD